MRLARIAQNQHIPKPRLLFIGQKKHEIICLLFVNLKKELAPVLLNLINRRTRSTPFAIHCHQRLVVTAKLHFKFLNFSRQTPDFKESLATVFYRMLVGYISGAQVMMVQQLAVMPSLPRKLNAMTAGVRLTSVSVKTRHKYVSFIIFMSSRFSFTFLVELVSVHVFAC